MATRFAWLFLVRCPMRAKRVPLGYKWRANQASAGGTCASSNNPVAMAKTIESGPSGRHKKSFLARLLGWAGDPSDVKLRSIKRHLGNLTNNLNGLPFYLGISKFLGLFLAYHPDSYNTFKAHPEFTELFRLFSANNRANNGGDIARLWSLILNCKQIISEEVEGDFAELGVWRGNTAAVLASLAAPSGRKVFLFDTYAGFDRSDLKGVDAGKGIHFGDTSIELVKEVVGPQYTHCEYVKGRFPDSITDAHKAGNYAVVSLDCDLYEPTKSGLEFFYPRMPRGGIFFLHDYSSLHWDGAKLAIDEFCRKSGEYVVLMPDKSGSAFLRKKG